MDFSFDKVADVLYIIFSNEKVSNTEEVTSGIIVDYGKKQNITGIEILNYSKRNIDLNELIRLSSEEIIPAIVNGN